MSATLLRREVLPFYLSLVLLGATALLADAGLHLLDLVWIGRYLGIVGVLLILGSFGYSLRKRKRIEIGKPVTWLRVHERMAWTGAMLVLIHAGIHYNALLGWLAIWAMLVNVGSGLTGKFLLVRAQRSLEASRTVLRSTGVSPEELAAKLHWDSLTVDIVRKWRLVHFPITLAFGVLALAHILSILMFWNWR